MDHYVSSMADPLSEVSSAGGRPLPSQEPPLTVEAQTALPSAVGAELDDFCVACGEQVRARLALRTVRLEESGVDVDGVLVAVCNRCDAVTSLLPESAIRLRDARARAAAP